jgi:hypothetical protein
MSDLEQRRRTVRVLGLLSESFEAHARGDHAACDEALDAALDCDPAVVSVVRGGMMIGEVPNPERDWPGWGEYVSAAMDALAEAEGSDG